MANRNTWRFQYTVEALLKASRAKYNHHSARLKFWTEAQQKVLTQCKEEGLVVHESLAGSSYSNKSPGFGPRIEIPEALQMKLNESTLKITQHTQAQAGYAAWVEVLANQPSEKVLEVDQEDYLFFYGLN